MPTNAEKKKKRVIASAKDHYLFWRMTLPFLVPQIHNAERASFTEQSNMLKVEISRDCCQGLFLLWGDDRVQIKVINLSTQDRRPPHARLILIRHTEAPQTQGYDNTTKACLLKEKKKKKERNPIFIFIISPAVLLCCPGFGLCRTVTW